MRSWITILLLLAPMSALAAIYECRSDGVRHFADRPCAEVERVWTFAEPPAAPPPARSDAPAKPRPAQAAPRRAQRQAPAATSYRCRSGARVWYQHDSCGGQRGERVEQQRIDRRQACREIARPAASLRRGSERDVRASPYDKAMGRDPCR